MHDPIRRARFAAVPLFILFHTALILIANGVLFPGNAFQPLSAATSGLINGTLVMNALLIATLVPVVMIGVGGLRLYDLGLIPHRLPSAMLMTIVFWAAAQAVHLLAGLIHSGRVAFAPEWAAHGAGIILGGLIAQLFGNALFEEIAYRGFLFPQFYLRAERLRAYRWRRFFAALAASQAVFALTHIPNRIYLGMSAPDIAVDLIMLMGWGVLYTLIYMRTDNLFLAVGVHALGNAPTTLFATHPALAGEGSSFLFYSVVIAGLFIVPLVRAQVIAWRARAEAESALGWGN